jgi:hypothetical protein
MPDFSTEIDIEPYEYVSACSKREIVELLESLVEGGHISRSTITTIDADRNKNLLDEEWDVITDKLNQNRLMLSNEEEELIRKISKRF